MKKEQIWGKHVKSFYFLISLLIFFTACEDKLLETDASAFGYEYFPVEQGTYRIYRVSSTEYSILGDVTTTEYFLKEVVSDSFQNLSNEYTYLLNRFTRASASEDWTLDSIWTAAKDVRRIAVTENNVPFIKLVFPLKEDKEWNGNALNTRGEELYRMAAVGKSAIIGEEIYQNTATVIQMDNPDTLLSRDKRIEIYGKNIGLLYKESVKLKYCSDIECIGEGIVESGLTYSMELIEYGKE